MDIRATTKYTVKLSQKEFDILAAISNYVDRVATGDLCGCDDQYIAEGLLRALDLDADGDIIHELAVEFANPPTAGNF